MGGSHLFTSVQNPGYPPLSPPPRGLTIYRMITDKQIEFLNKYFMINDDLIWLMEDYWFDPYVDEW